MARILIVEDDPATRRAIVRALAKARIRPGSTEEHEIQEASTGEDAISTVRERFYHLVITDLVLEPDSHSASLAKVNMDGIGVLEYTKSVSPDTVVVVLTGQGNIESAVAAMKRGAADYLEKPGTVSHIRETVERILREQYSALTERQAHVAKHASESQLDTSAKLIGDSPPFRKVLSLMKRSAEDGDITVLIQGETGTGKELIARAIHEQGPRARMPFLPVNCAALPDDLLETELFGYVRGAFTGADTDKPGLFQMADDGTIFLDEIADLAERLQAKLLRVLQEREVMPLGTSQTKKVNVRVIAATNQNLERRISEGRFRQDLFYRLNVLAIPVLPLREHREDIPVLLDHGLEKICAQKGRRTLLSEEARQALMRYEWPGNIRELLNTIESLVVLVGNGMVKVEHLPDRILHHPTDLSRTLRSGIRTHERELLMTALERNAWNATRASRELGITREALQRKMKQLEIERPSS